MIGVVDVGGGMRGIYGAGVFDWCMDNGVRFDYAIGVSAGSANLSSYMAGQRGRNYHFYADYAFRKEYMGFGQKIRTGNFLNLDYIYGTLSNSDGENPLDFDAFQANPAQMLVVASDALTGEPVYFHKEDFRRDHYGIICASCCVPWVNKPYAYEGGFYYDGGISDPIPITKAFDDGCDKVVLILTRPRDYYRSDKNDRRIAKRLKRKYPRAAEGLANRALTYNSQLDLAKYYEKEGKLLLIAPDSIDGMDTLTRDKKMQDRMYRKGLADAAAIGDFINGTA